MFKKLMDKKVLKNEKGLTLIELLAVIVILAIVAAIAIPAIGSIIDNSRYKAVKSDAINVLNAAQIYFTDEVKETTIKVGELKTAGYIENQGTMTDDATITKVSGGNTLKATATEFTGKNTVEFDGATINDINKDETKVKDFSNSATTPTSTTIKVSSK